MRVIKGRVFYRSRLDSLSLGVDDDGKVASIRKVLRGDEEIDHGDSLILPGCVDLHVHMRDPGLTHKEDFPSGTRAAAVGGVTTIAEMPNTVPAVTSTQTFEEKASALRGRGAVDYVLYAAPRTGDAVDRLLVAPAFKVYMAPSTGDLQVGLAEIESILREAAVRRKLVVVHAEDPSMFRRGKVLGLEDLTAARPKAAEKRALETVGRIRGNAKLHVAHVTCKEALDTVPPGATCEASPHHLFLDTSRPLGPRGKVYPPLRSLHDREALWDAFRAGRIDAIASDHAPHTLDEKDGPFDTVPAGVPGVATSFPLLMRRTRAGDIDLSRLVASMASRPADILGVMKGRIEVGRDADLIVVDPRRIEPIRAKRLPYKCGWTPFEGMEGCFPTTVYLHGDAIVEESASTAEGRGRLVASGPVPSHDA